MADHGGGDHDGRLADQPHAVAEIDVIAVAEQPLVKAPQLQEEVPVHQHGPAAGREHLARRHRSRIAARVAASEGEAGAAHHVSQPVQAAGIVGHQLA